MPLPERNPPHRSPGSSGRMPASTMVTLPQLARLTQPSLLTCLRAPLGDVLTQPRSPSPEIKLLGGVDIAICALTEKQMGLTAPPSHQLWVYTPYSAKAWPFGHWLPPSSSTTPVSDDSK